MDHRNNTLIDMNCIPSNLKNSFNTKLDSVEF